MRPPQPAGAAPMSLIAVVIVWSMFPFAGFRLISGGDATTLAALAVGAISVASVVDLTRRYMDLMRVSPAGDPASDRDDRQIEATGAHAFLRGAVSSFSSRLRNRNTAAG